MNHSGIGGKTAARGGRARGSGRPRLAAQRSQGNQASQHECAPRSRRGVSCRTQELAFGKAAPAPVGVPAHLADARARSVVVDFPAKINPDEDEHEQGGEKATTPLTPKPRSKPSNSHAAPRAIAALAILLNDLTLRLR